MRLFCNEENLKIIKLLTDFYKQTELICSQYCWTIKSRVHTTGISGNIVLQKGVCLFFIVRKHE